MTTMTEAEQLPIPRKENPWSLQDSTQLEIQTQKLMCWRVPGST